MTSRIRMMIAAGLLIVGIPLLVSAQSAAPADAQEAAPREDAIGLAPARFELPMLPGTERTVIVNIIYNSASAESRPARLAATLGDWTILKTGSVEYYKPGARPDSAAAWMLYSPAEVTAMPGKIHPIRVTISVPRDAAPGDHLAALLVEQRPDNIKLDENRRQVVLRFRMAALFYISVPQLTKKGSLQNLKAEASDKRIVITPMIKNEGNTHIRPVHSVRIIDSAGSLVATSPESESLPVLAGAELAAPLVIEKRLPPGAYSVRYRVDFRDGDAVTEGQVDLVVK